MCYELRRLADHGAPRIHHFLRSRHERFARHAQPARILRRPAYGLLKLAQLVQRDW